MNNFLKTIAASFLLISATSFAQVSPSAAPAQKAPGKHATHAKKLVTPASGANPLQLKKDGTPDKRYKSNKGIKKDGTRDKRYKAA